MSDKEKRVIHEMKTSVPKETAKGDPFKVENTELTEKDLETASGGVGEAFQPLQPDVCACLCGQGTGCSGGGGG